jgi:hypothetical protein
MSHPRNKRERFLIGDNKGRKRIKEFKPSRFLTKEWFKRQIRRRRNTTKLCSCSMCGNPRRKSLKDKLTMQERKFFESLGL